MVSCANHPDASAACRCTKCRSTLCDPCCVFLINGDPWCEPCGHGVIESRKGSPTLAVVVLLVLLAAWSGLLWYELAGLGRFYVRTVGLLIIPFAAAWRIAFPPSAKMTSVNRREKSMPLPTSKRLT